MTRDIRQVISTCPICQKIKHARHLPYGLLQPIPIPTQPFEVVTMDFIGELPKSQGYDSIFVLICKLTKYTFFIPCNTNLTEKRQPNYSLTELLLMSDYPSKSSPTEILNGETYSGRRYASLWDLREPLPLPIIHRQMDKPKFSTRLLRLLYAPSLVGIEITGLLYFHI